MPASPSPAPAKTPLRVIGHAAELRRHGELAVTSGGQLYLLGGAAGRLTHVVLPGIATVPTWSPDHHWLAVQVSPPAKHAYDEEPASLFLVRANGSSAHRVTPKGRTVTDVVWSPTHDMLAVAWYLTKHSASPHYHLDLVTAPGNTRRLLMTGIVSGIVWSPDGTDLAIDAPRFSHHGPERLRWRSHVLVVNVESGSRRALASRPGVVLDMAGWTPDASQVLYWPDPMGSGSIAADGLDLYAVPAAGGRPVHVAKGLTHAAWTAYSPNRQSVATVDGGFREVWGGHKHVDICPTISTCSRIAQPRDVVSLWPTWTPDGTEVVFARLPSRISGPFDGHTVAQWTRHSRLFVVAPGQSPHRLGGVPRGATAPEYAADGTLLFATARWVWLKRPGRPARRVIGPLPDLGRATYYGYVPYRLVIAWSGARSEGYAGTS